MGIGCPRGTGEDLQTAFISNIMLLNRILLLFLFFFFLFFNKPETWAKKIIMSWKELGSNVGRRAWSSPSPDLTHHVPSGGAFTVSGPQSHLFKTEPLGLNDL